jgi:hypothetical protein
MKHLQRLTMTIVTVAAALWSAAAYPSGGSCLPRSLTAAEKQAGERVLARLRPLLPAAPAGWRIDGADATDIASGSCMDGNTHKSVPQPVSVQARRRFVREGPAPAAAATPPAAATPRTSVDPQMQARAKALEQQIAELKRQEQEIAAAYRAKTVAGNTEAKQRATADSRQLRAAMQAPQKELMQIRDAERRQRAAEAAALHDTVVAQTKASLANRRVAEVSINTNSGRALSRASRIVDVPGTALAIADPGSGTNLLFGRGWTHSGHQAFRPWDPQAPLTRVQDVNVRVDGPQETVQALVRALDSKALDAVIER